MNIAAIFDDVDTAEHALVQLHSLGVHPLGYKIKRIRPSRRETDLSDVNPPVGLYNATLLPSGGSAAALNAWTMRTAREGGQGNALTPEGHSREVELTVTVEDRAGIHAHRALVSSRGRQVRYQ